MSRTTRKVPERFTAQVKQFGRPEDIAREKEMDVKGFSLYLRGKNKFPILKRDHSCKESWEQEKFIKKMHRRKLRRQRKENNMNL